MKKLLSLLVLIAVAPFVLKAEVQQTMEQQMEKALTFKGVEQMIETPLFDETAPFVASDHLNFSKNVQDTTLLFYVLSPLTEYSATSNQITYEPISQTVSVLRAMNARYAEGASGFLTVLSSNDFGDTWSSRVLLEDNESTFPLWSTLTTFNRNNTTDPNELEHIAIYRTQTFNSSTSTYPLNDGVIINMSNPDYNEVFPVSDPEDNNDQGGYSFTVGRVSSYQSANDGFAYMSGYGMPANDIEFQAGPAYFASFSLEDEDIDASLMLPNYTENEITYWGDSKGSLTVSGNFLDTDEDGNIYLFTLNHHQPNHPQNGQDPKDRTRTPAFMKSSDGGQTWTNWITFPTTRIIDFLEANGQDKSEGYYAFGGSLPYENFGFAVTGEDKFTVILPIQIVTSSESVKIVLTDLSYDSGTWLDPVIVHELPRSFRIPSFLKSDDVTPTDSIDYGFGNNLELQLAKVVDSDDLVLKFVQATHMVSLGKTYNIKYYDGQQAQYEEIDSLENIGIYGTAKINGTWSGKIIPIVDEDYRNERHSFIPAVVPSLERVPMTYGLALGSVESYYRYGYTEGMFDLCPRWYHYTVYGNFNFKEKVESAVEDNLTEADVNMNVYPNPATADAYIEYNAGNQNVRMEIYDVMGNKVMTVVPEQVQTAGLRTASINVSELSNGTYYVHLTVGNETFTKTLNVVR